MTRSSAASPSRVALYIALPLVLGFAIWTPAQERPRLFSKGPYLQAPGSNTMTIMWEALTNLPGAVRFSTEGQPAQTVRAPAPRQMKGVSTASTTNYAAGQAPKVSTRSTTNLFFVYEVTLTNLEPATTYAYAVELDGAASLPRRFRTFGARPERVRFVAYGDTRSQPPVHTAIVRRFQPFAPDFILHTGDLVARGRDYALWSKEFFTPLAGVIDEVPVLPALGNHEEDATNYLAYFHLPAKERWYSFDIGPVHVLALDYHFERGTNEQYTFARQDLLQSTAPWKIVFVHYPVFNIGGHVTGWGHEDYLPLFHEAKVDMVLAGHSHLYERFRPVAPLAQRGRWAITHVTTGGGGASLAPSFEHPALAAHASTNHFVLLEATPDTLTGQTITITGHVLDRFTLSKPGGQPSPAYLAQTYAEEWLKYSFDAARSLTARVATLPTPQEPGYVMFNLRPMKTTTQAVELDISISPDAAANYQMAEPLRVTTPAPGEPEIVAWGRVRATGRQRVTADRKGEISPKLAFQARISAGPVQTMTYGQRCRLSAMAAQAVKEAGGPLAEETSAR